MNALRELRQLWEENAKLKRLVADLSLNRDVLQEIAEKRLLSLVAAASWPSWRNRSTG